MGADIRFPHLGIILQNVGKSISIGGFSIAYYGIIIAVGMLLGIIMATWQAKRLGVDSELISNLAICDIICALIGARAYYVIFRWDYYGKHPVEIFNIRAGGLAIYGGVLAGILATYIFSRIQKTSFLDLTDVACAGLLTGQIMGRWGNFFNREAFGGYTDNLLAMQLKRTDVRTGDMTKDVLEHIVTLNGVEYIQVHPTFFYESLWNVGVLLVILFLTKHRRFSGQLFFSYLALYGLGRFWIEGLRTDQLKLFGTGLAVSQVLSVILVVFSLGISIYMGKITKKKDLR
ncbi:MAG: prolipoprotein diacylglyceryl transferase [Lachnospiraceae bacterium]|nr:prolipoprotein diacylglyceryl transferase [Lachnospiraceae bacterium]